MNSEMTWFGKDYDAPIYRECRKINTPAGVRCRRCNEPVGKRDDGFIDGGGSCFHRACFLRGVYGSVAHQLRICQCYTAVKFCSPPPEGMTVRQEAEDAVRLYEELSKGDHIGDKLSDYYQEWAKKQLKLGRLRSPAYAEMTAQEQWDEDKRLGILDLEG